MTRRRRGRFGAYQPEPRNRPTFGLYQGRTVRIVERYRGSDGNPYVRAMFLTGERKGEVIAVPNRDIDPV
jgi:hypothetical protein